MKIKKTVLKINFLSSTRSLRYFVCLLLTILLIGKLRAQETVKHPKELVWSSEIDHAHALDESLTSLKLSEEVLKIIDGIEVLLEKNLVDEMTVELYKEKSEEVLTLKYHYPLSSDEPYKAKQSIVTIYIERLATRSYNKDSIASAGITENSSIDNSTNFNSDQLTGNGNLAGSLLQNYPNPFDTETYIQFNTVDNFESARIVVSDMYGRQIFNFEPLSLHNNQIKIERDRLQKGVYFYHLVIDGNYISTKKMIAQ